MNFVLGESRGDAETAESCPKVTCSATSRDTVTPFRSAVVPIK